MAGTIVNPTTISTPDNQTFANNVFGKAGEQLNADLHGKFYTQSYRGELFYASNAPGTPVVIPAFSATSMTGLGLWNLSGNQKNLVPVRLSIGNITAASAANTKGWTYLQNVGSGVATAAPLSAATYITATRGSSLTQGVLGQGTSVASVVATATLTTAATTWCSAGFSMDTHAVANTEQQPAWTYDFDGTVVIQPNSFWWVAGSAADTGTYNISLTWYEVPV